MLTTGYMDESYDGAQQDLFSMSCLVAKGTTWLEVERLWKLHLAAKNRELKKTGRPLISRYHAADCSGRRNEFDGWNHDERDKFVIGLFGVIKRMRGGMHTVGYDISLDDLCAVFPEWANDRLGSGYDFLTKFVLWTLGQDHKENAPSAQVKITLFHDRTPKHDVTILNAFNNYMADPNFDHRHYFTTIAPLGWEDCIALQPADLVAFEVFKAAQAHRAARKNRKSFTALLDFKSFGIHTRSFDRKTLEEMREHIEKVKAGAA